MCVKRSAEVTDGKILLRISAKVGDNRVSIESHDNDGKSVKMSVTAREFKSFLAMCQSLKPLICEGVVPQAL